MNIIREEYSSYFTIFLRKSMKIKIIETILFIVLILILSTVYDFTDTKFKIGAIAIGILVLTISPLVIRFVVKPKYTLTENHLIIETFNSRKEILISSIEQTYDLRFFFIIEGKKTPLMISDKFIEDLNTKIEQLRRYKKNH